MRDLLNILKESSATDGQYLLATYNLEDMTWRVTFHPSREMAHVAYKKWSSAFTGDAYIAPVEMKMHADAASRKKARGLEEATAHDMETTPEHPDAALIRDYADLGVSTGYIGGVHQGPIRDDRQFRVFTQAKHSNPKPYQSSTSGVSIPVFDVPHNHPGVWRDKIQFDTPEVRAKLDAIRAKVESGEMFVRL